MLPTPPPLKHASPPNSTLQARRLSTLNAQPNTPSAHSATIGREYPAKLSLASPLPSPSSHNGEATQITSKVWDIPPRPKPGRKPASDAPPTKRKAQNRAAQRAFRERRAARVSELEEEQRKQQEQHNQDLEQLRIDFDRVSSERDTLQRTCKELEASYSHRFDQANRQYGRLIAIEREKVESLTRQLEQLRTSSSSTHIHLDVSEEQRAQRTLPQPQRNNSVGEAQLTSILDCSRCGTNGRCECIERILNGNVSEPSIIELSKQPITHNEIDHSSMEIDFTEQFSRKPYNHGHPAPETDAMDSEMTQPVGTPINVDDTCGFCTDSTNCVCKSDVAAANIAEQAHPSQETEAHIGSQSLMTPPDSTADADMHAIVIKRSSSSGSFSSAKPQPLEPTSFATGPGTCPSCMTDPARRRFCQTLAGLNPPRPVLSRPKHLTAQHPTAAVPLSSRPRNFGTNASMAKLEAIHEGHVNDETEPDTEMRVSCSDAYNMLMQDPNFEKHRDSVSFFEKLKTRIPVAPVAVDIESRGVQENPQGSGTGMRANAYEVQCMSILAAMRDT